MINTRRAGLLLVASTLVLGGLHLTAQGQATPTAAAPAAAPAVAAQPKAADTSTPISSDGSVQIDRFVLATGVEAREPVGEAVSFPAGTARIYAFVQLNNAKGAPYAITVSWEKVGGPVAKKGVELSVPANKQHRTWSWTSNTKKPGQYRAVLRTLDGVEVASREFTIEG